MKTYTYYIYHVPGIKIGCTTEIEKRMANQGFTSWEILETHTDIYVASNREQELQKEYGYRVDTVQYWQSVENRFKWDKNTRYNLTKEDCINGGRAGLGTKIEDTTNYKIAATNRNAFHNKKISESLIGIKLTDERKKKISEALKKRKVCPHCNIFESNVANTNRHMNNCKHKKS